MWTTNKNSRYLICGLNCNNIFPSFFCNFLNLFVYICLILTQKKKVYICLIIIYIYIILYKHFFCAYKKILSKNLIQMHIFLTCINVIVRHVAQKNKNKNKKCISMTLASHKLTVSFFKTFSPLLLCVCVKIFNILKRKNNELIPHWKMSVSYRDLKFVLYTQELDHFGYILLSISLKYSLLFPCVY